MTVRTVEQFGLYASGSLGTTGRRLHHPTPQLLGLPYQQSLDCRKHGLEARREKEMQALLPHVRPPFTRTTLVCGLTTHGPYRFHKRTREHNGRALRVIRLGYAFAYIATRPPGV